MNVGHDDRGLASRVAADGEELAFDLFRQHDRSRLRRVQFLEPVHMIDERNFAGGNFAEHGGSVDRQLRIAVNSPADKFRKLAQCGRCVAHQEGFLARELDSAGFAGPIGCFAC